MTYCQRDHCHGSMLDDDGELRCSLCGRPDHVEEPLPWAREISGPLGPRRKIYQTPARLGMAHQKLPGRIQ